MFLGRETLTNATHVVYVVYGAGKSFNAGASRLIYFSRLLLSYGVIL